MDAEPVTPDAFLVVSARGSLPLPPLTSGLVPAGPKPRRYHPSHSQAAPLGTIRSSGDAPLADTSTQVSGGYWLSGFYPAHPVFRTEPEPAGGCPPLLPLPGAGSQANRFPFRGYVSNSRPASALELKRRPFPACCAATEAAAPASLCQRSGRSHPADDTIDPKVGGAGKGRQCGDFPPAPAALRWLPEPPKGAPAAARLPSLPFAPAPQSEDMAAGHQRPLGAGSPEAVLRQRDGYPSRAAERPGASSPPEERGSEEPNRLPA